MTCAAPLWGAVNGYVKIPAGHHWHGLGYDEIDVEAPGGLTYSEGCLDWFRHPAQRRCVAREPRLRPQPSLVEELDALTGRAGDTRVGPPSRRRGP